MRELLYPAWLVAALAAAVVVMHHNGVGPFQYQETYWAQGVSEEMRNAAALPEVTQTVIGVLGAAGDGQLAIQFDSNQIISMQRLEEIIAEAAVATGLDIALIRAVVRTESDFRPGVVSSAGAVGLMQVRPVAAVDTARRSANRQAEWVQRFAEREVHEITREDLLDPQVNVFLGSHYLDHLHESYSGYGEPMALWLALAAYNWGPGNVYRHLTSNPNMRTLKDLRWLLNRRAPHETRAFIHRVLERSGLRMETT